MIKRFADLLWLIPAVTACAVGVLWFIHHSNAMRLDEFLGEWVLYDGPLPPSSVIVICLLIIAFIVSLFVRRAGQFVIVMFLAAAGFVTMSWAHARWNPESFSWSYCKVEADGVHYHTMRFISSDGLASVHFHRGFGEDITYFEPRVRWTRPIYHFLPYERGWGFFFEHTKMPPMEGHAGEEVWSLSFPHWFAMFFFLVPPISIAWIYVYVRSRNGKKAPDGVNVAKAGGEKESVQRAPEIE